MSETLQEAAMNDEENAAGPENKGPVEKDRTATRLGDGDGLEIAHAEDFGVTRNSDGEVNPLMQKIPGFNKAVKVKPLVGGDVDEWTDVIEKDEADNDRVDEFLREFIVEGIGSNGIGEVPDYIVPGLVQAVKNASGHEVFLAVEDQQLSESMGMIQQMQGVGDGILEKALEKSMDQQEAAGENTSAT